MENDINEMLEEQNTGCLEEIHWLSSNETPFLSAMDCSKGEESAEVLKWCFKSRNMMKKYLNPVMRLLAERYHKIQNQSPS